MGREVAAALASTHEVVGPVHVIPAGLRLPAVDVAPRAGVLVDGIKRPDLARELAARLDAFGIRVGLLLEHQPREAYLSALAGAEVAVLLPLEREGFYLPALEAMALATPVVTLDAIGNREYLEPGRNACVVAPDPDALVTAVQATRSDPVATAERVREGKATAGRFTLASERSAFAGLLTTLPKERG